MKERYETPKLEIIEFDEQEIHTNGDGYWASDGGLSTKPSSTSF